MKRHKNRRSTAPAMAHFSAGKLSGRGSEASASVAAAAYPGAGWMTGFWRWVRDENGFWALLLVALTVLAYLPALRGGFIWDDDMHLTANPCIVGPLGFKEIWTSSAATYYPLVLSSFWVQHALWGLNPLPYHLVNIAVHAASVLLLWLVLRCLQVRGAWLGAALWGLHPVQAESVAWITELKNTQSGLFYLLAIWFFLKWRAIGTFAGRKGTEWDYALALVCAALAIRLRDGTRKKAKKSRKTNRW